MATFFDPKNDFIVRDVPKGGGTTIRSWVGVYLLKRELTLRPYGYSDYLLNVDPHFSHIHTMGYKIDIYSEFSGESICITRDPVERFISCYRDKVIKEGMLRISIDDLLDNWDSIIVNDDNHSGWDHEYNYAWYHFAPQVHQLGPSRDNYTKVFDISEMSTGVRSYLEDKWKTPLPELHTRNSKSGRKIVLTEDQIRRVKEIYKDDYQAGWC